MSNKKVPNSIFNLGDTEFQRKLSIYYSWIAPVVSFLLTCVLIYDGAYLTGIIILLLSIFLLPVLKKFTLEIPLFFRALIVLGLIILAFLSINLYI